MEFCHQITIKFAGNLAFIGVHAWKLFGHLIRTIIQLVGQKLRIEVLQQLWLI